MIPALEPRTTPGARVEAAGSGSWRLSLPAGPQGEYRLAQLDDYAQLSRADFPWSPPLQLRLQARVSAPALAGTWGFGLWNDPFSLSLGLAGASRRLPALPNAAWFFFASPPNYLSFRDDLPAQGPLAATFQARRLPWPLLLLAAPSLPLLGLPASARPLRRLARRFIRQDAARLPLATPTDLTDWHAYDFSWEDGQVRFLLDGVSVLETNVAPYSPLALVLWLDNQYAALPPGGGLSFGTLTNPEPVWMELKDIQLDL